MSSKSRRACVFCGATDQKITREHILPEWVLETVPMPASGKHTVRHQFHPQAGKEPTRNWTTTDRLDLQVSGPCEPCNNGWMSELENEAKPCLLPMMEGRHRTYYADGQDRIARWVLKTALMSMLAGEDADLRAFARLECSRFFAERRPTPWTQIWTGASNFTTGGLFHAFNLDFTYTDETPAHYYAVAMRISQAIFQIVGPKVQEGKVVLNFRGVLSMGLTPFWPINPPVTYAPRAALTDENIEVMADLFTSDLIGGEEPRS